MSSGPSVQGFADGRREPAVPHIRAEQARLLYRNADSAVAVTLLVSFALTFLQWEVIPSTTLLKWLAYMAAVSLSRFALTRAYFRRSPSGRGPGWWEAAFTTGAGLAALGWGSAGVFLYPEGYLTNQVYLVFVLGGMMLGGGAILAARRPAFLAFLIPTGLPVSVRLIAGGDTAHLVMGLLMILATAATLVTTLHVHDAITASLALRFENSGLITGLQSATQRLEALNQELESRVQQRTAELDQTVSRLQAEIVERRRAEEERAALEAALRQTQKMEAIGVLSGGIAHQFNNLLTSISGYTTLVRDSLADDVEVSKNLDEVLRASDRAASLVRRLLVFSRKTDHKPTLIPATGAVLDALELVRSSLPSTITLRTGVTPECGYIFADPNLIRLVVVNLCTNAHDAMSGQIGVLEVNLEPVELGGAAPSQPGLSDGAYIKLTVRDTGPGIPTDIAERVFDPFFTTKPAGTATGLGLSVVHGIVSTYGGLITFESRPVEGTRFVVFLPRMAAPEPVRPEAEKPEPPRRQRILLVDDEEAIARLGATMLQRLGHTVTIVTSSLEALDLFREHPESFDLLVTDLTMPGMTGRQLIRRLRETRPHLPVVLMSGFNDAVIDGEDSLGEGATEFLGKPFSRTTLADAISRVLRRRAVL